MKVPSFLSSERIWLALVLAVTALVAMTVWIMLAFRVMEPKPLTWDTLSRPIISRDTLTISAEVTRRDEGCTSGPQIDLQGRGELMRLPVPTRVIKDRLSTYQTVLVAPLAPGDYSIRLREIIICGQTRHDLPSPWIAFRQP